jgi:signal transduction histidine kinase
MKSMTKVLVRYVASAAGVALILLVLNLVVALAWVIQASGDVKTYYRVSEIADGLTKQSDGYAFSEIGQAAMNGRFQWAMLLNEDGAVIWSQNLPDDVKRTYTISEVASFTRWYLEDYPVQVWRHPDGLLVLGSPKGSLWKMKLEAPQPLLDSMLAWFPVVLLLNGIVAVLLALLFGIRLMRSLRPIAKGIEDLAEKRPVTLSTGGILGDLAMGLNQTSVQLLKQEEALQKRDNARTTWISAVSHDIRTPLSMVMGYASQLEENSDLPLAEREKACIIRRQSETIKALVSDLNLASKLEYDMQPLRLASVYPAVLLRSVVAAFINGGLADRYSIEINLETSIQSAVITADEELLRRAISNLIANSIQHNPDGCMITISAEANHSFCEIAVSDNGVGFPSEVLETMKNSNDPTEIKNHGLGLTIVRQIIKAHCGMVESSNLSEGGCKVVLRLPISAYCKESRLA